MTGADDPPDPDEASGPPGGAPDPPGSSDRPPDLRCADCGRRYAAGPDEPWRCECGGPLEFGGRDASEDGHHAGILLPDRSPPDPAALDRRRGLWAFAEFLPVGSDRRAVTLGEGWTPEVDAPGWDARFKLEYVFPTGSFKDRGAATTLSRAAALGVERVVEDSSGNAGAAIATYAARAGIEAEVYVPAGAKPAKVAAIERAGADVVRVEGTRADVTDACVAAAETGRDWYASHAWHPAFLAGTATVALEVAADRGWSVPDAVVVPVGHGTLLLGAYRGFRALADAGWIDRVPRLLAAQAAGCAPVVDSVEGSETEASGANTVADGVRIRKPARRGQILDAVEETGGAAVAVRGTATRDALSRLRRAGFYVEPTSALAPAALEVFRERGVVDGGDDVVVPLTGSGLKDVADGGGE